MITETGNSAHEQGSGVRVHMLSGMFS